MKKTIIVTLLAMLCTFFHAQNMAVTSFVLDEGDLTANLQGTTVLDQNGGKCALIRIQTTQKGFSFDVGSLGVQKVDDNKVGEVWLYVPAGVRRLDIRHQQLGSLLGYNFPVAVMAGRTYKMQLTTGEVQTIVRNSVTQQYVQFNVTPQTAIVEFDGDVLDVAEGIATKRKSFGTYSYTVQAPLHHPKSGSVTVNDPKNKHVVTVALDPAFGYLEVPEAGAVKGAKVFVNNEYKGTTPFRSDRMASGQYLVRLVQPMYSPVQQQVTISDNQTTRFSPSLSADFATLTLKVGGNAEIRVNDESKGSGSWTGQLASGAYRVECRKPGHRTTIKELTVEPGMNGQTIQLAEPSPIYGTLDISSTPANADIYIDGEKVGTTPMIIPQCLVGSHSVRVAKAGHSDYLKSIDLAEGKTEEISATLQSGREVTITATPGATIYVDGKSVGTSSYTGSLPYGTHTLYAEAGGKKTAARTLEVTAGTAPMGTVTLSFFSDRTFTVGNVSFTMVAVEGGTFTMGATSELSSDAGRDEKPTHSVTLSSYYIGQTEVTQALWKEVMGSNPSIFKGDTNPVEYVSWNDCQTFIQKLNQRTGKTFRLPTEAEWEYAARGVRKSRGYKYSGGNVIATVAWYGSNSGYKTHAVGTKASNELGIYDMSGNVWEWCNDRYGDYSSNAQTNPTGAESGSYRVNRGGSWGIIARFCRSSSRSYNAPSDGRNYLGLRLVLSE